MSNSSITLKHLPAGENGFFRAPILLSGATEAVLIDGGFTLSDGAAVVEEIKASGKKLTTIYISQSDPDYYFSLGPIKAAFPDAKVITASATLAAIQSSVEKKLAAWGPQLQDNGPKTLADVVMPEAFDGDSLTVDGELIEIVTIEGLPNRRYLWVPSLNAVVGGVLVFSDLHVWTADTATAELRATWVKTLDSILARKPEIVIPGHMTVDAKTDVSAVTYTQTYLKAFEEELAKVDNSADLIDAMTKLYPDAGLGVALQIGSKVNTNEMKWG
ncbi:MBL fold metallo-hydrolase [Marinomonas transparens]|uniref:MBL fold metallo-hydrolase n=1 Tax=Marinomonas transparens TaxID=2795388 RepID=A0A934JUF0_9GAMM|nr:MBL fold metallo-hydrolase [Marinomonas transparens]MBJ7537499.1 MBL fold metallo-hydrolase [Marinomonas transparens]